MAGSGLAAETEEAKAVGRGEGMSGRSWCAFVGNGVWETALMAHVLGIQYKIMANVRRKAKARGANVADDAGVSALTSVGGVQLIRARCAWRIC